MAGNTPDASVGSVQWTRPMLTSDKQRHLVEVGIVLMEKLEPMLRSQDTAANEAEELYPLLRDFGHAYMDLRPSPRIDNSGAASSTTPKTCRVTICDKPTEKAGKKGGEASTSSSTTSSSTSSSSSSRRRKKKHKKKSCRKEETGTAKGSANQMPKRKGGRPKGSADKKPRPKRSQKAICDGPAEAGTGAAMATAAGAGTGTVATATASTGGGGGGATAIALAICDELAEVGMATATATTAAIRDKPAEEGTATAGGTGTVATATASTGGGGGGGAGTGTAEAGMATTAGAVVAAKFFKVTVRMIWRWGPSPHCTACFQKLRKTRQTEVHEPECMELFRSRQ